MGMCKPSGGIKKQFGSTRVSDDERMNTPNSRIEVYKDERYQEAKDVIAARWYDPNGYAVNDRDYTDHGFPETHKYVPHDHPFTWRNGKYARKSKSIKPRMNFCDGVTVFEEDMNV